MISRLVYKIQFEFFLSRGLANAGRGFYNRNMKYDYIIIAGPTASGKSDFAHLLAKRVNGAIINCDSVQIYRDIETVSASPFAGNIKNGFNEIDGVPYKLFSVLPLTEHISVADYLTMARDAMNEVIKMGKIPIFVGGSGYYINVLINGISPIPEISEQTRNKAREMIKNSPDRVLELLPKDFTPRDPQRMARAIEVLLETGKPLSHWQNLPRMGALPGRGYKVLILPNREILLERIARRVPEMIRGDAVDEARNIIANNLPENRAIGTEQICKMLRGEISEADAVENWIVKTNQYAKRQRTWYKTQYVPDFQILNVPNDNDIEEVIKRLF